MEFKRPYEEQLLYNGYESLAVEHKNMLVSDLAYNYGITFNEVTMSMILDVHKMLKLAETREIHQMEIEEGFVHQETGRMYDITLNKQVDMIGIRVLLQTTSQDSVEWLTEDSGVVTHTEEEFIELFEGVISYKEKLDTKLIKMNEAIMQATATNDIIVLDWYTYEFSKKGGKVNDGDSGEGQILHGDSGSEDTGSDEGTPDSTSNGSTIDGREQEDTGGEQPTGGDSQPTPE